MTGKTLALAAAGLLMAGNAALAQTPDQAENYGSNSAAGNNASVSSIGGQNAAIDKSRSKDKRQARPRRGKKSDTGKPAKPPD
jgi:hypothetical protein